MQRPGAVLARKIIGAVEADADPPISEWVTGLTPRELTEAKYRVGLAEVHERRAAFRASLAAAGRELAQAAMLAETAQVQVTL